MGIVRKLYKRKEKLLLLTMVHPVCIHILQCTIDALWKLSWSLKCRSVHDCDFPSNNWSLNERQCLRNYLQYFPIDRSKGPKVLRETRYS